MRTRHKSQQRWNGFTYEEANDIEKILVDIENLIISMGNWFVYSGVSRSGQNRLWQNRFRHFFAYPSLNVDTWADFGETMWADFGNETWQNFG